VNRNVLYQLILIAVIAGIGYIIISATQTNLAQLGVDSSFDFLWKRAGFEIGQTLIPYSANSTISRAFIVALLNTLVLAFVAIACASMLGLIIGVARLSSNWLTARLATVYIEIFRNIPSLLQIFFWYFVVLRTLPQSQESFSFSNLIFLNNHGLFMPAPVLSDSLPVVISSLIAAIAATVFLSKWAKRRRFTTGKSFPVITTGCLLIIGTPIIVMAIYGVSWEIPVSGRFSYQGGFVLMPEFIALVIGLSIYNATYIAEIVRSGFNSIAHEQTEAADSLGLPRLLTLRLILFPQALRVIIPPLTTLYLNIFKSTSLAAAIAYPEIVSVFVGTVNNLVGQPVIIMAITLFTYAVISLCVALILNWYHKRIALSVIK
jgi:general L-amino acid transport system permease protein